MGREGPPAMVSPSDHRPHCACVTVMCHRPSPVRRNAVHSWNNSLAPCTVYLCGLRRHGIGWHDLSTWSVSNALHAWPPRHAASSGSTVGHSHPPKAPPAPRPAPNHRKD